MGFNMYHQIVIFYSQIVKKPNKLFHYNYPFPAYNFIYLKKIK